MRRSGLPRSGPAAGVAASRVRRRGGPAADMWSPATWAARRSTSPSSPTSGCPATHPDGGRRPADVAGAWSTSSRSARAADRSAGSTPGACSGSGRSRPGRARPGVLRPRRHRADGHRRPAACSAFSIRQRFLGGDMALDAEAAIDACARLGEPLGLDAEECAWGIRRLALDGMATAVRSRLDARGLDAADLLARQLRRLRRPFHRRHRRHARDERGAGAGAVLGAVGLRRGDRRIRSANGSARWRTCFPVDARALAKVADELRGQVDADLAADGVAPQRTRRALRGRPALQAAGVGAHRPVRRPRRRRRRSHGLVAAFRDRVRAALRQRFDDAGRPGRAGDAARRRYGRGEAPGVTSGQRAAAVRAGTAAEPAEHAVACGPMRGPRGWRQRCRSTTAPTAAGTPARRARR